MKPTRTIRSTVASLIACFLCFAASSQAATPDELLTQIRQFRYGQDTGPLTEMEKMVAAAAAGRAGSVARDQLAESLAALLETGSSFESKQFVCHQLALIGTARQVPILAALLADEKLSDMARYALTAIPDSSVDQALRASLARARGKVKIGLINSIGLRRDQAAVDLLTHLLNHPDLEMTRAAAAALGRIGGRDAAEALKKAWTESRSELRLALAEASLVCAENFMADRNQTEALAIYRQLFASGEPARVRAAALLGLMKASQPADALRTALAGLKDPPLSKTAIGSIQMLPGHEATLRLAAALADLPSPEQAALMRALAVRGDPAALPALIAVTSSGEAWLRVVALQALGRIGDGSAVGPLLAAAGRSGNERQAALESLRSLRGPRVDEAIVEHLGAAPVGLQTELTRILAQRHATGSVPALFRLAQGPEEATATEAAKALGEMAEPDELPALFKVLAGAQAQRVREATEEAIIIVSRKIAGGSGQSELALSALREAKNDADRASLLRVLAGIGDAAGLESVRAACQDGSDPVRDAAVRALAAWPHPEATEALLGIFATTPDATHRALALRGLVRLAGLGDQSAPTQVLSLYQQIASHSLNPDEIRLVLSGLSTVAEALALELVEPYLDNQAVREEAAVAMLKIAASLPEAPSGRAKQCLERASAVSKDAALRKKAGEILRKWERR